MEQKKAFWWYIDLKINSKEEAILTLANETECIGAEQKGGSVWRLYFNSYKDIKEVIDDVCDFLESFNVDYTIVGCGKQEYRNWVVVSKESFKPIDIGKRFTVSAPWFDIEDDNRIPIYIHPGCAFGTGYHESTQIALMLIERLFETPYAKNIKSVFDVGCGSGILSIAVAKLKDEIKVVACDLDPQAIKEATENAKINAVLERINFLVSNLTEKVNKKFDLVIANILYDVLVEFLDRDFDKVTHKGSYAIFSGLVLGERQSFLELLKEKRLSILFEETLGEWWGVCCKVSD